MGCGSSSSQPVNQTSNITAANGTNAQSSAQHETGAQQPQKYLAAVVPYGESGMIPLAKRQKFPHKIDLTNGMARKPACMISSYAAGSAWICRCGQSSKFPYCDGTHKLVNASQGTNYSPIEVSQASTGKTEACALRMLCDCCFIFGLLADVCGCSWSNARKTGQPFCDGAFACHMSA